jgi:hypothetical protein
VSKEVELNLGLEIGRQILYSIQNLKMAQEQFDDYCRQYPKTRGADLFSMYSKKIDWIFRDIVTHPFFTRETIDMIKNELKGDPYLVSAIIEKIELLNEGQREIIEDVIDAYISGETVKIVDIKNL